jgi:hypothetical protein
MMRGPIDYIVVEFPGNKFKGEILPELLAQVEKGVIGIIDLVLIVKDELGEVTYIELADTDPALAAVLAPLKSGMETLLSEEDEAEIAELLDSNSSAGVLVIEHLWAKGFKQAIINAEGVLLAEGRVHASIFEEAVAAKSSVTAEGEE